MDKNQPGPKTPIRGLESSIWANKWPPHHDTRSQSVPPPRPSQAHSLTRQHQASLGPEQAFRRFQQTCQRLRWKHVDLQSSYQRALNPEAAGFSVADAEVNFKLDWHEFYSWIEQALVLVFRVFGFEIRSQGGDATTRHTYHHDVLRSLEDGDNPMRELLGTGDVYHALWKAKELRNRWKDAAEGKETPPLKMYDLSWVVSVILGGLEKAYVLAESRVGMVAGGSGLNDGEEEWAWMAETMDWEPL
ncbi:hypothetical protein B0I35DRAFT_440196 [Stachybotrys elegans]|uniref:Uncharacterized protein n=1 Tax=Stachybotrys elegans TaxID=80388 RepID=A0A8K0WLQ7_9HYPO|nr:hypothetical protein B0I35DRAFT_440196 [Stachybotrys elegans]